MAKPRRGDRGGQLALPFPEAASPRAQPRVDAGPLVALHGAVRLLLGVAEGRVVPSDEALDAVRHSLDVLAAHRPRGRLGHVVRRYRAKPLTDVCWGELVDELAFVLSLAPDGPPDPVPTRLRRTR
ncbi:MAG TPA: hypothetical protein VM938_07225 [Acidimicrobiales bacterium]|nr:hypothetical protein [Acidimicrobiales bacterium]